MVVQKQDRKATLALCLGGLGCIAALENLVSRAIVLFAVSQKIQKTIPLYSVNALNKTELENFLSCAKGQVDENTFNAAWEKGDTMGIEQAIDYALG